MPRQQPQSFSRRRDVRWGSFWRNGRYRHSLTTHAGDARCLPDVGWRRDARQCRSGKADRRRGVRRRAVRVCRRRRALKNTRHVRQTSSASRTLGSRFRVHSIEPHWLRGHRAEALLMPSLAPLSVSGRYSTLAEFIPGLFFFFSCGCTDVRRWQGTQVGICALDRRCHSPMISQRRQQLVGAFDDDQGDAGVDAARRGRHSDGFIQLFVAFGVGMRLVSLP